MQKQSPSRGLSAIPNLFTLLNLIFGCFAIVYTLEKSMSLYVSDGVQYPDFSEQIWMASLFIGLAGVVDFLDGFVARLFKATSEMGKQLDSLADVVSFGVAPGLILYEFIRLSLARDSGGLDAPVAWTAIAFVFPAAAAWRLAKFNLSTDQGYSFRGIPTPAAGLLVASLPLIYWNINEQWVHDLLINKWFLYFFIIIISLLMVSNIRFMSFKFRSYAISASLPQYLLLTIALVSIIFLQWLAVPVIFVAYVLVSLAFKNKIA